MLTNEQITEICNRFKPVEPQSMEQCLYLAIRKALELNDKREYKVFVKIEQSSMKVFNDSVYPIPDGMYHLTIPEDQIKK